MNDAAIRHKLQKHGFEIETLTIPQLVTSVANYIAQNYNLEECVTETATDLSGLTQIQSLLNILDDAPEILIADVSKQSTHNIKEWFDKVLAFLTQHLDSSLLFAIENVNETKICFDEVIVPEELDDVEDFEYFAKLMEMANYIAPPNTPKRLFTDKLTVQEWEKVQQYANALSTDFRQRCLTLLNRLDVTVMSFLESSKAEGTRRDEIITMHEEFKTSLALPMPARVPNLLAATEALLAINSARGASISACKSYILETAPPNRDGVFRSNICLYGDAWRGRQKKRRGNRRSEPQSQQNKQQKTLFPQAQVNQKVNCQLGEACVSALSPKPFHPEKKES